MVEAGKEHSSIMDADLEVGDEETTTSTQYSNGRALHSSSSASVKVRYPITSDRKGWQSRQREKHAQGFRQPCACQSACRFRPSILLSFPLPPSDDLDTTGFKVVATPPSFPHALKPIQIDDFKDIHLGESFDSQSMARSLSSRGVVFEWNILKYKVKLKKRQELTVLSHITGRAESGSFSAIMGPSGCGKTSLLDCLALRTRDFKGGLALDGKPLRGEFYANTGYVNQKELFFPHLTVREHLIFHAINRLSHIRTDAECTGRVATVMEEVDLTKVADQKIGGGDLYTVAGLSGGERKRLNIATEMLADPRLLLLDEPTSGESSGFGFVVVGYMG